MYMCISMSINVLDPHLCSYLCICMWTLTLFVDGPLRVYVDQDPICAHSCTPVHGPGPHPCTNYLLHVYVDQVLVPVCTCPSVWGQDSCLCVQHLSGAEDLGSREYSSSTPECSYFLFSHCPAVFMALGQGWAQNGKTELPGVQSGRGTTQGPVRRCVATRVSPREAPP